MIIETHTKQISFKFDGGIIPETDESGNLILPIHCKDVTPDSSRSIDIYQLNRYYEIRVEISPYNKLNEALLFMFAIDNWANLQISQL